MAGSSPAKRILFLQYTDPNGYPPLEHASLTLASAGWDVAFVGVRVFGAEGPRFPDHPKVRVALQRAAFRGWIQKVNYAWFLARCLGWCLTWRPNIVYCSEPLSTPAGLVAQWLFGARVVYHEHDTAGPATTIFTRAAAMARKKLIARAAVCIVPQKERLESFRTAFHPIESVCVWNCPRREEAVPEGKGKGAGLKLFYVGTLNRFLLPETLVRALAILPGDVELHVVGYETSGTRGYAKTLEALAGSLHLTKRIVFHGPMARSDFFKLARQCDVGLSLVPNDPEDPNLRHLFGASNKVFDYMACGLPVLVSNHEPWSGEIARAGYGVACDPKDPESIRDAVLKLAEPEQRRRMGNRGRERILGDWNYETQFAPVIRILES